MTDKPKIPDTEMTDDEIAAEFLTAEERAALAAPDDDTEAAAANEDGAVTENAQPGTEDTPAAKDADDGIKATAIPEGEPSTASDPAKAADPVPQQDQVTGKPVTKPVPLLQPIDVSVDQERLNALSAERDTVHDRYESGEIDAKQMRAELSRLDDERLQARLRIERSSIAAELAQQQAIEDWRRSVEAFAQQHPAMARNPLAWSAFDRAVQAVTSDPANAALTDRQQLDKALGLYNEAFGVQPAAGSSTPTPTIERPAREVPPLLGKVPAAATMDADDGRFGALDRLADTNPEAYEDALARLSEADREAYLAS